MTWRHDGCASSPGGDGLNIEYFIILFMLYRHKQEAVFEVSTFLQLFPASRLQMHSVSRIAAIRQKATLRHPTTGLPATQAERLSLLLPLPCCCSSSPLRTLSSKVTRLATANASCLPPIWLSLVFRSFRCLARRLRQLPIHHRARLAAGPPFPPVYPARSCPLFSQLTPDLLVVGPNWLPHRPHWWRPRRLVSCEGPAPLSTPPPMSSGISPWVLPAARARAAESIGFSSESTPTPESVF